MGYVGDINKIIIYFDSNFYYKCWWLNIQIHTFCQETTGSKSWWEEPWKAKAKPHPSVGAKFLLLDWAWHGHEPPDVSVSYAVDYKKAKITPKLLYLERFSSWPHADLRGVGFSSLLKLCIWTERFPVVSEKSVSLRVPLSDWIPIPLKSEIFLSCLS